MAEQTKSKFRSIFCKADTQVQSSDLAISQQATLHAQHLRRFVTVDNQLSEPDRRDLARGIAHVNTGSLMSGSIMGLYMLSARMLLFFFCF